MSSGNANDGELSPMASSQAVYMEWLGGLRAALADEAARATSALEKRSS
jgi:hypothetical protein